MSNDESPSFPDRDEKLKTHTLDPFEINLAGNFVTYLYNRSIIGHDNDWCIQKCQLRKEYFNITTEEMRKKLKNLNGITDIGKLLNRCGFLMNTPKGSDYFKIKYSTLFEFLSSKTEKLIKAKSEEQLSILTNDITKLKLDHMCLKENAKLPNDNHKNQQQWNKKDTKPRHNEKNKTNNTNFNVQKNKTKDDDDENENESEDDSDKPSTSAANKNKTKNSGRGKNKRVLSNKSEAVRRGKIAKHYGKGKQMNDNQDHKKSNIDSLVDELPRVPGKNVNFSNPKFLEMQQPDQTYTFIPQYQLQNFNNTLQQHQSPSTLSAYNTYLNQAAINLPSGHTIPLQLLPPTTANHPPAYNINIVIPSGQSFPNTSNINAITVNDDTHQESITNLSETKEDQSRGETKSGQQNQSVKVTDNENKSNKNNGSYVKQNKVSNNENPSKKSSKVAHANSSITNSNINKSNKNPGDITKSSNADANKNKNFVKINEKLSNNNDSNAKQNRGSNNENPLKKSSKVAGNIHANSSKNNSNNNATNNSVIGNSSNTGASKNFINSQNFSASESTNFLCSNNTAETSNSESSVKQPNQRDSYQCPWNLPQSSYKTSYNGNNAVSNNSTNTNQNIINSPNISTNSNSESAVKQPNQKNSYECPWNSPLSFSKPFNNAIPVHHNKFNGNNAASKTSNTEAIVQTSNANQNTNFNSKNITNSQNISASSTNFLCSNNTAGTSNSESSVEQPNQKNSYECPWNLSQSSYETSYDGNNAATNNSTVKISLNTGAIVQTSNANQNTNINSKNVINSPNISVNSTNNSARTSNFESAVKQPNQMNSYQCPWNLPQSSYNTSYNGNNVSNNSTNQNVINSPNISANSTDFLCSNNTAGTSNSESSVKQPNQKNSYECPWNLSQSSYETSYNGNKAALNNSIVKISSNTGAIVQTSNAEQNTNINSKNIINSPNISANSTNFLCSNKTAGTLNSESAVKQPNQMNSYQCPWNLPQSSYNTSYNGNNVSNNSTNQNVLNSPNISVNSTNFLCSNKTAGTSNSESAVKQPNQMNSYQCPWNLTQSSYNTSYNGNNVSNNSTNQNVINSPNISANSTNFLCSNNTARTSNSESAVKQPNQTNSYECPWNSPLSSSKPFNNEIPGYHAISNNSADKNSSNTAAIFQTSNANQNTNFNSKNIINSQNISASSTNFLILQELLARTSYSNSGTSTINAALTTNNRREFGEIPGLSTNTGILSQNTTLTTNNLPIYGYNSSTPNTFGAIPVSVALNTGAITSNTSYQNTNYNSNNVINLQNNSASTTNFPYTNNSARTYNSWTVVKQPQQEKTYLTPWGPFGHTFDDLQ